MLHKKKTCLSWAAWLLACISAVTACSEKPNPLAVKEAAILDGYRKHYMDDNDEVHDSLQTWLLTDSTTMEYAFQALGDYMHFYRAASEDSKICIYSWQVWDESYRNVIQVATETGFRSESLGLMALADKKNVEKRERGCMTTTVRQLKLDDGSTVYLTHSGGYPTSAYSNELQEWAVFRLDGNRPVLVKGMFVDDKGNIHDRLNVYLNISDWYVRNPEGQSRHNWGLYDARQQAILFPVVDIEERMLDRYRVYTFDGRRFRQDYISGNPLLHEDLQDYEEMVHVYKAGELYVRIDRMGKDKYRYASWHAKNMKNDELDMTLCPDIILDNGVYDEDEGMYRFHKGQYEYLVPEMTYTLSRYVHAEPAHPAITVTLGGKTELEFIIN